MDNVIEGGDRVLPAREARTTPRLATTPRLWARTSLAHQTTRRAGRGSIDLLIRGPLAFLVVAQAAAQHERLIFFEALGDANERDLSRARCRSDHGDGLCCQRGQGALHGALDADASGHRDKHRGGAEHVVAACRLRRLRSCVAFGRRLCRALGPWDIVRARLVGQPHLLEISAHAVNDLLLGRRTLARAVRVVADEIVVEASLALLTAGTKFGFEEFSRRAGDYALAMCLAVLRFDGSKVVEARIGVGGAEPFPRRINEAEAVLVGHALDKAACRRAAEAAAKAVDPMSDVQADPEYRRDLVLAMVRRALEKCLP